MDLSMLLHIRLLIFGDIICLLKTIQQMIDLRYFLTFMFIEGHSAKDRFTLYRLDNLKGNFLENECTEGPVTNLKLVMTLHLIQYHAKKQFPLILRGFFILRFPSNSFSRF